MRPASFQPRDDYSETKSIPNKSTSIDRFDIQITFIGNHRLERQTSGE